MSTKRQTLEDLADEVATRLDIDPEDVAVDPRAGHVCLTARQLHRLLHPAPETVTCDDCLDDFAPDDTIVMSHRDEGDSDAWGLTLAVHLFCRRYRLAIQAPR